MKRMFAVAVAATLLSTAASATIYTIAFTGNVRDGRDYAHYFGAGDDVAGQAFTTVFRIDQAGRNLDTTSNSERLDVALQPSEYSRLSSAILTINGRSMTFYATGSASYARYPYGNREELEAGLGNLGMSIGFGIYVADLYDDYHLASPIDRQLNTQEGERAGDAGAPGLSLNFNVSRVIVSSESNGGTVPEPATWAMMAGGFGLLGTTMRRRRTAVSFT